jgi:hypothetical protein
MGDVVENPRNEATPDDQHDRHEGHDLAKGQGQGQDDAPDIGGGARHGIGKGRQEDQGQHHGKVLDDEPADRDVAPLGFHEAALLQRPQQHDRTGDRERQAEDDAAAEAPPHPPGQSHPQQGGAGDLNRCARNGDGLHREQILEGEMQPDAEHQQNDADLRELVGETLVRHVAGREGAHENACQQVADQGRDAQAMRQGAENKCQNKPHNDHRYQRRVMRHRLSFEFGYAPLERRNTPRVNLSRSMRPG